MASRIACDPRRWNTFHSTITADGTRYRHQIKQHKKTKTWYVRTEVWADGDAEPYYNRDHPITEVWGPYLFELRHQWTNVAEEGRPMYPAGCESGFLGLPGFLPE